MSQKSDIDPPTPLLIAAGKILRTLKPSPLGLLHVLDESTNTVQNQGEIADGIGRTQSTVSQYFQTLETLTPPLTAKRGQRYMVTDAGERVIDLVDDMLTRLGVDPNSIDWAAKADKDDLASYLTPLHDSVSMGPIFILDSIYARSGVDGLLGTPNPVWINDVFHDVEVRENERGVNTSMKQVRQTVENRFDDTGVASFDGSQITLENRGHKHGYLLDGLTQFLTKKEEFDVPESGNMVGADSPNSSEQIKTKNDRDSPPPVVEETPTSGSSTVILGYCPRSAQLNTDEGPISEQSPVLPLTAMTVEDLVNQAKRLPSDGEEDAELVPYWLLKTDSGLYPLEPMSARTGFDTDEA